MQTTTGKGKLKWKWLERNEERGKNMAGFQPHNGCFQPYSDQQPNRCVMNMTDDCYVL